MATSEVAAIVPHSGPLSVTKELTSTGNVLALLVVRISEKKNSFQEKIVQKAAPPYS